MGYECVRGCFFAYVEREGVRNYRHSLFIRMLDLIITSYEFTTNVSSYHKNTYNTLLSVLCFLFSSFYEKRQKKDVEMAKHLLI